MVYLLRDSNTSSGQCDAELLEELADASTEESKKDDDLVDRMVSSHLPFNSALHSSTLSPHYQNYLWTSTFFIMFSGGLVKNYIGQPINVSWGTRQSCHYLLPCFTFSVLDGSQSC